jgi:hypothetical protein
MTCIERKSEIRMSKHESRWLLGSTGNGSSKKALSDFVLSEFVLFQLSCAFKFKAKTWLK